MKKILNMCADIAFSESKNASISYAKLVGCVVAGILNISIGALYAADPKTSGFKDGHQSKAKRNRL
jgi:hypothetical protein